MVDELAVHGSHAAMLIRINNRAETIIRFHPLNFKS